MLWWVVVSTEPLWASLFGMFVLGEQLNGAGFVGGGLILGACLLSQMKSVSFLKGDQSKFKAFLDSLENKDSK